MDEDDLGVGGGRQGQLRMGIDLVYTWVTWGAGTHNVVPAEVRRVCCTHRMSGSVQEH